MTDTIRHEHPWGPDGSLVISREGFAPLIPATATQWSGLFRSANFNPRETFSPSAIELAWGCESAWGYRYLWGLKELEYSYAEIMAGAGQPKDRARAFGKGLHADSETYYRTGAFDQSTEHGKAFASGTDLIPKPNDGALFEIELGLSALDTRRIDASSEPIAFVAYKDLVHWHDLNSPVLYDWKSTSDFKWCKTQAQLQEDLAANMYGLDTMMASGRDDLVARWVYFKSRNSRGAKVVDFVLQKDSAKEIVHSALITAAHLRAHIRAGTSPEDLDKNAQHCPKFAATRGGMGCPYHYLNGGPCNVKPNTIAAIDFGKVLYADPRSFELSTEIRKEQENTMSISIEQFTAQNPKQANETIVAWKVRVAQAFNSLNASGQNGPIPTTLTPAAPMGFAPPPQGFLQPPALVQAPPAPQQAYAPALPMPPPPAPVYPPVSSHVLPPEASAAPQPAALPSHPPATTPTAPAEAPKRRGRPARATQAAPPSAPAAEAQPDGVDVWEQVEISLNLDGMTITLKGEKTEEVRAVAGMIKGLFA